MAQARLNVEKQAYTVKLSVMDFKQEAVVNIAQAKTVER
jgi:hypothetical protein